MAKDNICSQINALINELANDNDNLRQRLNETQAQLDKANAQLQEGNIPNVIRTLPVEIVDFINYFCDVVKNTDVCRDGEIQAEWINYNKNKDGKVSV